MMSLSDDKQADIIDAFNTTSRYLDDILNINNVHFDDMVSQIYPSELQLNKVNFELVNFPLLDVMFLALYSMESMPLNSFVLLEHLAILLTSTLAINY